MTNDIAESPKKLLNTHSFFIDVESVTGKTFSGKFTVHRPTIGELIRVGVIEANSLGGLSNVDLSTSMLAHMVATLDVIVDESPEWWKVRELRDMEVVQAVYDKCIAYLREFQRKPEHPGSSEEGSK
jgi:hypothetical protein